MHKKYLLFFAALLILGFLAEVIYLSLGKSAANIPETAKFQAIWFDDQIPASSSQVALFRKVIHLKTSQNKSLLKIFADTRYEVYLDGQLIGRGPARFSANFKEYDEYQLPELASGKHLLAVLVQWAPNIRRSESTRPMLLAQLLDDQGRIVTNTGPDWKTFHADAWREDTLAGQLNLIGAMEYLDFRKLPPAWNQAEYNDTGWAVPVRVPFEPDQQIFQKRSIPFLKNVPMAFNILETGVISPKVKFGELASADALPYQLKFAPGHPGTVQVNIVAAHGVPEPASAAFDGREVSWSKAGEARPDIYVTRLQISAAGSVFEIRSIPADGLTFSVQSDEVDIPDLPFGNGLIVGRRWMLAEPMPDAAAVQVTTDELSVDITSNQTPAYAILDAGRSIHGWLTAEVEGPAGTIIDIGWDEKMYQGKKPLPYAGSLTGLQDLTDSWVLDGHLRKLQTIDTRAGRYIVITLWGHGTVRLSNIRLTENRYPVEAQGRFESNDTSLNRIWQIGVDTLYPNMTDGYTDTPWRERGQWWGDATVSYEINRAVFGDQDLLKRGLRLMARSIEINHLQDACVPNGNNCGHMLDYALLWVRNLAEYVRLTNDTEIAKELYPQVKAFLDILAQYKADWGLLSVPEANWGSSNYLDTCAGGSFDRWGISTAVNSLYYDSLLSAAYLAEMSDHQADTPALRADAAQVRSAINAHLYDPANQRYYATRFKDEIKPATIYAQAYALSSEIPLPAEGEKIARSLSQMMEENRTQSQCHGTYIMHFVLDGLGKYQQAGDGLQLIRAFYQPVMAKGAVTWWEYFESDTRYANSYSHAWSGSPTWFLSRYVLGADTADGKTWVLQPLLTDLTAVKGEIPLSTGSLSAAWQVDGQAKTIVVNAPVESSGKVIVPIEDHTLSVEVDGTAVWQNNGPVANNVTLAGKQLSITLMGGPHTVRVLAQP